jgi:hypothetical protein
MDDSLDVSLFSIDPLSSGMSGNLSNIDVMDLDMSLLGNSDCFSAVLLDLVHAQFVTFAKGKNIINGLLEFLSFESSFYAWLVGTISNFLLYSAVNILQIGSYGLSGGVVAVDIFITSLRCTDCFSNFVASYSKSSLKVSFCFLGVCSLYSLFELELVGEKPLMGNSENMSLDSNFLEFQNCFIAMNFNFGDASCIVLAESLNNFLDLFLNKSLVLL